MFKFFHGWQRKIGCVALVVGCAFAAGWVRSSWTADYVALAIGRTRIALLSQQGSLSSGVFSASSNGQPAESQSGWWTVKLPATDLNFIHYPTKVPYWSVVIPLLLLSAWLLIAPPRVPSAPLPPSGSKPTSSRKKPTSTARSGKR